MGDDKVMIVFYKLEGEKRITSFWTKRFAEWLKLFEFAKNHDVEFVPNGSDEKIDEAVDSSIGIFCVEEYNVKFGSDDSIQCIEVWFV